MTTNKWTDDEFWMDRALKLSEQGVPAPNPHVGCVVVSSAGQLVGEGFHAFAGADHAEVMALKAAGDLARGGTAYVTLEPCNHTGRTPPCSHALRAAGIRRVVVGTPDPTALAGGGAAYLSESGIAVDFLGQSNAISEQPNRIWLKFARTGSPFVTLKLAISLDGMVSAAGGVETAITGEQARQAVHQLRGSHGAVLVGSGTVESDDPLLNVRSHPMKEQPLRVILDRSGRLDHGAFQVFDTSQQPTWHVVGAIPLKQVLKGIAARGIPGVLVEGGIKVAQSFLNEDLVDAVEIFVAPRFLPAGLAMGGETWPEFDQRFQLEGAKVIGQDARLTYVRRQRS